MRAVQQVAVLGLGRFGIALASELTRLGYEVLAVDQNERVVRDMATEVTHAVQSDITDEDAIRALGVGGSDAVFVGAASNIEASVMATVVVKRLGVPRVIARAKNEIHGSILEQVGASRVAHPERETGLRLAHSFAAPAVRDYLDVAPGYGMARVQVPQAWVGHSLGEVNLEGVYQVTVLALSRQDNVTLNPRGAEVLQTGDGLIVAGLDEDLARLPSAKASATE